MNVIIKKVAIWIPVILMAIVIFGFSKQDGAESSGLSRKAAACIVDFADYTGIISVDDINRGKYIEQIQYPIRKLAHMSEYAVFGVLIFIALSVDGICLKYRYRFTVFLTFIFACSDEIHQLFVPGRNGDFTDVIIDICGCLIAMAFIKLIMHFKIFKLNFKIRYEQQKNILHK